MTKLQKLKIYDRYLLLFLLAIVLSSIHLEVTHSSDYRRVWVHIISGTIFMLGVAAHIQLHFGWKRWFYKFSKQKSVVTRILWWLWLLTAVSALVAFIHWLPSDTHSPVGGIHGKIGLLMLAFSIGHTVKRAKFLKKGVR